MRRARRRVYPVLVPACLLFAETVRAQETTPLEQSPPVAVAPPEDGDPEPWIDVVWPGQQSPPSGDYLRVGGLATLELIDWGSANDKDDGLETDALSLLLSGRLGAADVFVDVDLDGEDTRHNLREAWVDGSVGGDHWLRAGWLRVALGSEFATREEDLPSIGYTFPSSENGRFGPGVALDGYPVPWLWWQATATAGHDANLSGDQLEEKQFSLRAMATPEPGADGAFEGLFGGLALATTTDLDGPLHVETPLDQSIFTTETLEGERRTTVVVEMGYRSPGFRFGAENSTGKLSGVALPGGGEQTFDEIGGWSAYLAWNLRGTSQVWSRGRWLPHDLQQGEELPVELSVRYSNADIDRDLFDTGLASFGTSIQEVRSITVALSAYLQPLTRVAVAYVGIVGDQEISRFGDHDSDQSLVVRLDQRF
jgi:hypothetical protein